VKLPLIGMQIWGIASASKVGTLERLGCVEDRGGYGSCHSNSGVAAEILGAKLGANDHRLQAKSGYVQPSSPQPDGTSGHTV
jgi:hypothetical protein